MSAFLKSYSRCLIPIRHSLNTIKRTFAAQIGAAAPTFNATAVNAGKFETIKLEDFKGKWVVLFFYPLDFSFVCPTEIIEFSNKAAQFRKLNAEVLGASIDSQFTHLAWIQTSPSEGGLGAIDIPLIADMSRDISSAYGCLQSDGVSVRATYIIDDKGIVRHISLNDRSVGRNIDEYLRLLEAFQTAEKYGEVCPANWTTGEKTVKADPYKKLEYFQEKYANEDENEEEESKK